MDDLVLKEQRVFLTTNRQGEIPAPPGAWGLYHQDTRFLSRFELRINGQAVPLLDVDDHGYEATLTYGRIGESIEDTSGGCPPGVLLIRARHMLPPEMSATGDQILGGALRERITLTSYRRAPVDIDLTLMLAADFQDMFAVRGFAQAEIGVHQAPALAEPGALVMAYLGRDGLERRVICCFSPPPSAFTIDSKQRGDDDHPAGSQAVAQFALRLAPKQALSIELMIEPSTGVDPMASRRPWPPPSNSFEEGRTALVRAHQHWIQHECTEIETDAPLLNAIISRSLRDLRLLVEQYATGPYVVAGIPWFAAPFGRDGLITSMQTLMVNPRLAVGTLRYLAAHQGQRVNPDSDEDPGKIMHEMRSGELVRAGDVPFGPYYGSADTTPLFLVLLGCIMRWLDDDAIAQELELPARAALTWLDQYGDVDGDGYVEFERKAGRGLANQGWKDSGDSLQFPDGSYADPPIALVEVQGYTYAARRAGAALLRRLGDETEAARQEAKARALREQFNRDFWLEDERYFAQALDGHKRPVPAVTSNPGHCLWSGIVDDDKAALLASRLLADDMCSGWGIRTLSSTYPSYDPLSYHNGSVWPHDTSLIVAGLKRYGHDRAAATVFEQVADVASNVPEYRLPELYAGLPRRDGEHRPVPYPVSCSPQAWAAASILLMLQSVLGLDVDAAGDLLSLRPVLPTGVRHVTLRRLRAGSTTVSLDLELLGDETLRVRRVTEAGQSWEGAVRQGDSLTIPLRGA